MVAGCRNLRICVTMPINMLYVDDDEIMRETVSTACRCDPDFTITTAASGEEALTLARDNDYDLVLLDVVMPGLDGPATLALLRTQAQEQSVLAAFVTAHLDVAEQHWLQTLGVAGILAKPIDPMTLTKRLRSLVREGPFAE